VGMGVSSSCFITLGTQSSNQVKDDIKQDCFIWEGQYAVFVFFHESPPDFYDKFW
jgi:hypothetical protein